nr:tRNA (guanine-N1)-methyltransferase [Lyngbya confervoides]
MRLEGRVQFHSGDAFYRSASRMTRDLGVLAAAVYRSQHNHLRVLDVMTGCGVRALRYVVESKADWVWANDGNLEHRPLVEANLAQSLSPHQYHLSFVSAREVFAQCQQQQQRFDWVDIDAFGSPAAHLAGGLAATRMGGYLYLTATDGKSLAGQNSRRSLGQFNAYARYHPAKHEQGLRILIGLAMQQAQLQHLSLGPVLSFFCGKTYRVLLKLQPVGRHADQDCGFLGYCHHCGQYTRVDWRSLPQAQCLAHPYERPLVISGPMWLGPLHHPPTLKAMQEQALAWDWPRQVSLLDIMQAEAPLPPFYYPLAEIGRRGRMDIPNRDRLIQALQNQGYAASRTSVAAQAIKSSAPLSEIVVAARRVISG